MLLDKVREALRVHQMSERGDLLIVGGSGGPDSLALLDTLHALAPELDLRLHVAHLDHQLRAESAADARFVADVATRLGLPVTVGSRDVPALQAERRLGVEEAARLARYGFFADVVAATGARGVCVGHTADDQVETVVLHWLRGTGLAGLQGMRPVTVLRVERGDGGCRTVPLRVLRPLLGVTRAEVEAYCQERGLAPRLDASNAELTYARNRVRRELIPALEAQNPRFRVAALRLARQAAEDEEYLAGEALRAFDAMARVVEGGFACSLDAWRQLPAALQARVLREAFSRLAGDLAGLAAVHVESARQALAAKPAGTVVTLPRGIRLVVGYGEFRVTRGELEPRGLPTEEVSLAVPGVTPLPALGAGLVARLVETPCAWGRGDNRHADLDFDVVGPRLAVRRRRPGDRLVPLGMSGTRKLQDVLVDARVPRAERDRVPVVTNPHGIVWAAGVRLDDRYKVTSFTRRVLCLRIEGGAPGAMAIKQT